MTSVPLGTFFIQPGTTSVQTGICSVQSVLFCLVHHGAFNVQPRAFSISPWAFSIQIAASVHSGAAIGQPEAISIQFWWWSEGSSIQPVFFPNCGCLSSDLFIYLFGPWAAFVHPETTFIQLRVSSVQLGTTCLFVCLFVSDLFLVRLELLLYIHTAAEDLRIAWRIFWFVCLRLARLKLLLSSLGLCIVGLRRCS